MLMAALGDIHGNLPALEAVLAEIDDAGIQTIVNTGDAVVGGDFPNEVVDLLRARNVHSVQGIMDRRAAAFHRKRHASRKQASDDNEAIAWTHTRLRSEYIEFLAGLPKMLLITVDGIPIAVCHGTPSSQAGALHETDDVNRFRRERERTHARIVVCGYTHHPFTRWVDDTLFVNPGAVGVAKGAEARACYALIDTEEEPWNAVFRRVAYRCA